MMKKISFLLFFFSTQLVLFGQEIKSDKICKIISLNISGDGTLVWITQNEARIHAFIIEEYRWNKWVEIGEVYGNGLPKETSYSFKTISYSGKNKIRVRQGDESNVSKELEFNSKVSKVTYSLIDGAKQIKFSSKTLYEIIDASGTIVKRGFSDIVSYSDLPKGTYTLNYDNSIAKFVNI
ncbi:MAG: hypothetical protein ACXVNF_06810 [Neobacillus sp.]